MTWHRLILRVVLFVAATLGVALLFAPTLTTLLLAQAWLTVSGAPASPPPIARQALGGKLNRDEAQATFDASIARAFPIGSDAAPLRKVLAAQHFEFRSEQIDSYRSAVYAWGSGFCGSRVEVWWKSDAQDKITAIDGYYYVACL